MIVPVLPHDHWIFAQLAFVVWRPVRRINEEPDTVAVPKTFLGIIGIFFLIGPCMVANMIRTPAECRILQRPAARDQQYRFHPGMAFKTAMGNQPVVADRNTQAGKDV